MNEKRKLKKENGKIFDSNKRNKKGTKNKIK